LINQSYKNNRRDDDLNSPLSVQPWGADTEKRRYFLIEGADDTSFRIYRESNPAGFERTWWSVAGTIDELKALAEKIGAGGPKGLKLSRQMLAAVPRFEATEEVFLAFFCNFTRPLSNLRRPRRSEGDANIDRCGSKLLRDPSQASLCMKDAREGSG
jgi:hypothetical protein